MAIIGRKDGRRAEVEVDRAFEDCSGGQSKKDGLVSGVISGGGERWMK